VSSLYESGCVYQRVGSDTNNVYPQQKDSLPALLLVDTRLQNTRGCFKSVGTHRFPWIFKKWYFI